MELNILIPVFALTIQLISLFCAIRLLRYTENRIIGIVLVLVMFLMSFRRALSLFRIFSDGTIAIDMLAELVALSISVLILCGIILIARYFKLAEGKKRAAAYTEILYRTLFDQSPDGVLLMNMQGELLEFNNAAHRQLGYTRDEFKTLRISDLDPVESPAEIQTRFEKILQEGKDQFEVKHITKQGDVRDVLIITQTIELNGELLFHAIWHDITKFRRAEKKLISIMKAVESSSDAIGISDAQGHHFYQNKALSDLFGYATAEELEAAGGGAAVVHDPEVAKEMFEHIMQGKSWAGELEMVTKSGQVFPALERADAVTDHNGKLIGLIGIISDITERKKAEEALRHFQLMVDNATDAIGMSTHEGRHYYQNEAFTRLFGLSVREVDGLTGPPATVYADEEVGRNIFATIIKGGSFTGEVKMLDKDRDERDIYLRAYSIKDNKGIVAGLVGIHTDITERKKAEERIKKSERQLLESQRVAHLGNWDLNLVSLVLEWSAETYRLFDKSPENFVPSFNEFARLVHPGDHEYMQTSFNNALESDETPYHVAVRIINDSGREWVMEALAVVRRDPSGKALRIFGTAQDITEQKKAEEKIRKNEEFIRNILDTVDEGFIVVDREYHILTANSAYCSQMGDCAEKIIGRHCYEVSHKTDHPCHEQGEECAVLQVFKTGRPHTTLHRHTDAEGNILYVETKGYPFKDQFGTVTSAIETINNITEKHLLEEERLKSQKLESIGTLAGGIAHDFNNLLQGVFGFISLAKKSHDQKDKSLSMLEQAEKALHLSVNLTNQLLIFSKGGKPVKKLIRVMPVVENAVKFALSGSNTNYELDTEAGLWPVEADEGQLVQVIQNIVLNANQAMADGGTVRVTLSNADIAQDTLASLPDGGQFIRITIQDSGMGINKQDLARIFDPYFTTKQKGHGLGLATSYSIIKNHGGMIEVKSKVNTGTTFTIYIPAAKEVETVITSTIPNVIGTKKGRILLMDDEELIRDVSQTMISVLGHDIVCARDGLEAIALFREAKAAGVPFDLVILDLTVKGGMGGEEAIKKIREIDPAVKAVVSSGYADSPVVANYRDYGFSAVLNKPYELDALNNCLNQYIQV